MFENVVGLRLFVGVCIYYSTHLVENVIPRLSFFTPRFREDKL